MKAKTSPAGSPSQTHETTIVRLGTRSSALALWQARHVAARLERLGVRVELVEFTTSGDRDLKLAIEDLPSVSPFTDDLEAALQGDRIDLAVHSMKDLPVHGAAGFTLAAVLPRADARETLVSVDHRTLYQLPSGAKVGTCSTRRAVQLRHLRPDLVPVPIRGAVDDRVQQVREGRFDATVLAAAGLSRLGLLDEVAETFCIDAFIPAPAQGALVVQVRESDERTADVVRQLEDSKTRDAVTAELAFLAAFEARDGITAAAHASIDHDVRLRTRILTEAGEVFGEAVYGDDPRDVAERAIAQAESILEHATERLT